MKVKGLDRNAVKMINTTPDIPTNLNSSWLNMRGTWITNILLAVALRMAFSLLPGVTGDVCWTLTNMTYNIVKQTVLIV